MFADRQIASRWLSEAPIYVVALSLCALCLALLASKGVSFDLAPVFANARLYLLSVIAITCLYAGWQLYRVRPDSPVAFLKDRLTEHRASMAAGIPLLILLVMLMPFFSKMKAAIPLFNSYSWDQTFIAWDRAIFGGYDAWEVLQPLLGYPIVTAALALLYQLWFLLLYIGCLFFAFHKSAAPIRRQFFLTYVLSWTVVGGAMATWLASVGPCFIGPILGDKTFDGQMAYLESANREVPVMTLQVQQMLLDWHAADSDGLGSGITAMPSMHVAVAFLFWLAARRLSASAGRAFFVFLVLIWLGSVHLAYHYAVDGLVSIIAVTALWYGSGALIAAWDRFLAKSAQPALRTNTVPAE